MLFEDDFLELFNIMEPFRPRARAQADEATDHFNNALQQQEYSGYGNECFVVIDGWSGGAVR